MVQSHERRSISVVTPVYNGEASVGELCRRLAEVLPRIAAQHEVILVNDGSRDRSWETISELCSRSPVVRGLNLMRNYGQHNALLCGIRAARYDLVVTMDDDLQHPPEEIPRLLARLAHTVARSIHTLSVSFSVHRRAAYVGNASLWRHQGTSPDTPFRLIK